MARRGSGGASPRRPSPLTPGALARLGKVPDAVLARELGALACFQGERPEAELFE